MIGRGACWISGGSVRLGPLRQSSGRRGDDPAAIVISSDDSLTDCIILRPQLSSNSRSAGVRHMVEVGGDGALFYSQGLIACLQTSIIATRFRMVTRFDFKLNHITEP